MRIWKSVRIIMALFVVVLLVRTTTLRGASKTYPVDTLIIPMDLPISTLVAPDPTGHQDRGMLQAYGLVYKLLSGGVPVDWVIKPGKASSTVSCSPGSAPPCGTSQFSDFTVGFRTVDYASNPDAVPSGTHDYRGGPFVIDAAHRAAALPIIEAWQTNAESRPIFNYTVVHEATAPFTADVSRSLVAAPRIAILADGNEEIAFGYLRAAGIPDSRGVMWPAARPAAPDYVDVLPLSAVAGPTTRRPPRVPAPAGR